MDPDVRVLVLFSNPDDTSRLRLDKEHRAIDKVLDELRLSREIVRRLHAVTLRDAIEVMRNLRAEVIQFSGHGSDEGIYFDTTDHRESELVNAEQLSSLVNTAASPPRVLLLLSCFSSLTVGVLGTVAPYLITFSGETDDDACIEFASAFYSQYLKTASVERAFWYASEISEHVYRKEGLYPVLSRRATTQKGENLVTVATRGSDSVLVDTSLAEDDIHALGVPRDEFLTLLCRKIRFHTWAFVGSSEGTVLSIGPYFGRFTWTHVDDPVILQRLMRLRENVTEEEAQTFGSLLISYNDLRVERYRNNRDSVLGFNERDIKMAIEYHHQLAKVYFEDSRNTEILRRLVPEMMRTAIAMIPANLTGADLAFNRGDLGKAVVHLETSLTIFHDLVDAVTNQVTQPTRSSD